LLDETEIVVALVDPDVQLRCSHPRLRRSIPIYAIPAKRSVARSRASFDPLRNFR